MNAETLRTLLLVYIALSAGLAFVYMARRRLTLGEWVFWGLVAILLPVFGPFFVISARPGPRPPRRLPTQPSQPAHSGHPPQK
jgi:hypothetical protein